MSTIFVDLCIIGAGPAGVMAALSAKKENPSASVLIVEARKTSAYRIGEALLTGTILSMAEVGIESEIASLGFHKKIGAAYVWGETRDPWYVNYPKEEHYPSEFTHDGMRTAIHVPRDVFDSELRRIAMDRGVDFIYSGVVGIDCTKSNSSKDFYDVVLSITLNDGTKIRAGHFIDASGQQAILAKSVTTRYPIWAPRIAKYAHIEGVDWQKALDAGFSANRTNIISHEKGWMWMIHLGDKGGNRTSMGFVLPPRDSKKITESLMDYFPSLSSFGIDFSDGNTKLIQPDSYRRVEMDHMLTHPDYSYASSELHGVNWSLCGDSALFLDPILSQGVTLAMHYGLLRGRAAVNPGYSGSSSVMEAQWKVTEHYRKEASILERVVSQWYANNRCVKNWHDITADIEKDRSDLPASFRRITNLENLSAEYHPFPDVEQENIRKHLDIATVDH